jgi:hypothetical protein
MEGAIKSVWGSIFVALLMESIFDEKVKWGRSRLRVVLDR